MKAGQIRGVNVAHTWENSTFAGNELKLLAFLHVIEIVFFSIGEEQILMGNTCSFALDSGKKN